MRIWNGGLRAAGTRRPAAAASLGLGLLVGAALLAAPAPAHAGLFGFGEPAPAPAPSALERFDAFDRLSFGLPADTVAVTPAEIANTWVISTLRGDVTMLFEQVALDSELAAVIDMLNGGNAQVREEFAALLEGETMGFLDVEGCGSNICFVAKRTEDAACTHYAVHDGEYAYYVSASVPLSSDPAALSLLDELASDVRFLPLEEAAAAAPAPAESTFSEFLIEAALASNTSEIDVSSFGLTEAEYLEHYDAARYDPRFLHVSTIQYWLNEEGGVKYVNRIQIRYRVDGDDLSNYATYLSAAADALQAQIDSAWSDFDKVAYLHDWLCLHVRYDHSVVEPSIADTASRTPLGALMYGRGVCSSYASAFSYMCDRLGIPCEYVRSEEMNHAWNMVCLDGVWYHVDATFDDPDAEPADDQYSRLYFLVGDDTLLANGYWGWTASHEAPQDHSWSGALHYRPEIASFDQIVGWVRDAGFFGEVDVAGYGMTPETLDYEIKRLCQNLHISASWSWTTDADTGLVKSFRFTS